MKALKSIVGLAAFAGLLVGCGESAPTVVSASPSESENLQKSVGSKTDSSAIATFVDFELDGRLKTTSCWNANSVIESQMLYTVGQLNGDNSVGRLDKLELSNVETETIDGMCHVSYHARLLVAWGEPNVPSDYELILPHDVSTAGQEAFLDKYGKNCLASGAHDVTAGIFWYYYRPAAWRCEIDDADVVRAQATVHPSPVHTTGKYPEYHEVWKDDVLEVVAVFGKYKDEATSNDAGIDAYNKFTRDVANELRNQNLVTEPADVPYNPGVNLPEVVYSATLPDGRAIRVVAILIDSVGSADYDFWNRYEQLTPTADLIVYNGHAGLGANIRKLASRGKWVQGQYAIVFMNGCDTYAYIDSALNEAHAAVNPDDPEGTKYVDIVANAMPSFFRSMSSATMALIRGLMDVENPRTYEQIFEKIDAAEVVLVTGEHDNVYVPGYGETDVEPAPGEWAGLAESGTVAEDEEVFFDTEVLPAGRYTFVMDGDGDADLYVRRGSRPSEDLYDCRPYENGSAETCEVVVDVPTTVHVMVRGYAASSRFELIGESN